MYVIQIEEVGNIKVVVVVVVGHLLLQVIQLQLIKVVVVGSL
jgi:hypothetical protein